MKKLVLPVSVGFSLSIVGLVCLTLGLGLQFVILCVPALATLALMIVIELAEANQTNKSTETRMMDVITATSSDFKTMKEYVDNELHEVYVTIASDRYDDE